MRAGGYDKNDSPFSQRYKLAYHLGLTEQGYEVKTRRAFCSLSVVGVRYEHEPGMEFANLPTTSSASLYETTNKQRCESRRGLASRVPPDHAGLGHKASSVWADCTWGGVINILDRKEPDRDRADPLKSSL
jgi:hypothetical protein